MRPGLMIAATAWLLLAGAAHAEPRETEAAQPESDAWIIDPAQSRLGFTAIENHAPTQGNFPRFRGSIRFDRAHPETARIAIDVPLGAVETTHAQVADTLALPEWFDSAHFPEAHFESSQVTHREGEAFAAQGTLTLKGVSRPLTLRFHFTQYETGRAVAVGEATLTRQDFNVGSGEWAASDSIGGEVRLAFTLAATRTP